MKNFLDIWYIPFKNLHVETSTLNQDEIKKAHAFAKKSDKNNYILSHTYLRKILSSYFLHVESKDWSFEFNEYKKPYIKEQNFHFNLSHSKNCAYIICSDSTCGIDVEQKTDIEITEGMKDLVFCEDEIKQKEDFYEIWTLKEAYLKAKGTGIVSQPLNELNIKDKMKTVFLKSEIFDNNRYLAYCVLDKKNIQPKYRNIEDLDDK